MEIKVTFLGAAQNVTGSRHLLEINGFKLLIDCGFFQERPFQHRNWDEFPIPPGQINAVLLTHAHLDHCGWLPKLVKEGFHGKIYATGATAKIASIVMLDSAHIQEEDAQYKKKRHKREKRKSKYPVEPLYTIADAEAAVTLFSPLKYETPTPINDGIDAVYYDAGHILGSAMIQLNVNHNGEKRTLLFSGDIGRWNVPILNDPTLIEQADYVFVESTYGDRLHETNSDIKERLAAIINETRAAGGNIVVPSFAVERAQEILYYLNELLIEDRIPHLITFLDSPMAVKVTQVFKKHPDMFDEEMLDYFTNHESPFSFPGLTLVRKTSESKAINHIRGTAMIIAGSGMCTGGRIKHHLVNNITRPESTILFIGYQAFGTLGRHILEKPEEVRILGKHYPIKARIERLGGFSGHADRDELTRWLSGIKTTPKKVFVVHGEAQVAQSFAQHINKKFGWESIAPEYQDQVTLT